MTSLYRLTACMAVALVSVACSSADMPAAAIPGTTTGAGMAIEFRLVGGPPTAGENTFDVAVTKDGARVTDAAVTAVFSMPAMPAMNMPAMESSATLLPHGDGRYRGTTRLSMAGTWNVVVKVSRGPEELGSQRLSIVAN